MTKFTTYSEGGYMIQIYDKAVISSIAINPQLRLTSIQYPPRNWEIIQSIVDKHSDRSP